MHESMELVFLGTGASWPSVERNVPAIALKRGSEIILFDCGEGTQRQFQRSAVSYMQVQKIFISHLHADHYLGLPGLVQTMKLNERKEPLLIYGPPGTRAWCERLGVAASGQRIEEGAPAQPATGGAGGGRGGARARPGPKRGAMPVEIHEIQGGAVIEGDGYAIHAKEVRHTCYALAYALVEEPRPGRFNKPRALELGVPEGKAFSDLQRGTPVTLDDGRVITPDMVLGPPRRGRKVVYTGDCVPSEHTVELAMEADVLIHESTYASDFADANKHGHSTAAQAAFIAKAARVDKLYLTHISPRYTSVKPLVEEAQKLFSNTEAAADLMQVVVKFPPDEKTAS